MDSCVGLMVNCVIYYNLALLSGLVDEFEKEINQKAIGIIANLSPIA
ncbi:TPA: Tn3 family transposase [Providencia alcalifaciens]